MIILFKVERFYFYLLNVGNDATKIKDSLISSAQVIPVVDLSQSCPFPAKLRYEVTLFVRLTQTS